MIYLDKLAECSAQVKLLSWENFDKSEAEWRSSFAVF